MQKSVSKEHRDCIKSLKCYDCESYRNKLLKKRSGQTCSWIFNDRIYRQWIDKDNFPVLWISGGPGSGKSVLSSVISQQLERGRFITLENNYSVAYFFCDDKDDQLSSAHAMLANVLGQLLEQDPKLIENFEKESKDSNEWDKISWSPRMLERVFDRIVRNDKMSKIFLIIDALGIDS
jgi:predicted AAA+ superfamily ATPase